MSAYRVTQLTSVDSFGQTTGDAENVEEDEEEVDLGWAEPEKPKRRRKAKEATPEPESEPEDDDGTEARVSWLFGR